MQPRRSLRLMAGALVLASPLLGSCGFGKATDKVYTPAAGINNRDGEVDVLAAVVVSAQPGSGTFIASLSNNSPDTESSLEQVAGARDWEDLTVAAVDPPVELPARGFANLADEGGVAVSGDFAPGDVVSLTLTFGAGDTTTLNVPVVYACDEFTGLDSSVTTGSSQQSDGTTSPSPGDVPTDDAGASPTGETTEAGGSAETYDCAVVLEEE